MGDVPVYRYHVRDMVDRKGGKMTPSQLRKIRLRLGLTQARLGEVIGRSQKTILRWEGGKTAMPHWAAEKINTMKKENEDD